MASELDLDALRSGLAPTPEEAAAGGPVAAAVLVALVPPALPPASGQGGWYLLLTRRTEGLSTHAGELSFPGGRLEPGEASLTAALREADEELGIEPAAVTILGALPAVDTRVSGYSIRPWVGVLEASAAGRLRPNPAEVAAVIKMSLADLAAPGARREQRFIRGRRLITSPAFDVAGVTVWGASARIVHDLLARIDPAGRRGAGADPVG